jgi:hypothetical protein
MLRCLYPAPPIIVCYNGLYKGPLWPSEKKREGGEKMKYEPQGDILMRAPFQDVEVHITDKGFETDGTYEDAAAHMALCLMNMVGRDGLDPEHLPSRYMLVTLAKIIQDKYPGEFR